MALKTRNYRFKGINPHKERNRFWLMIVIALLIGAVIYYL
jgi:hypothetical protein